MQEGFSEFEHCFDQGDVNVANDVFEFEATSGDGVCITSLSINDNQLLVGANNNLQGFWLDTEEEYCLDSFVSVPRITIQNEQGSTICQGKLGHNSHVHNL